MFANLCLRCSAYLDEEKCQPAREKVFRLNKQHAEPKRSTCARVICSLAGTDRWTRVPPVAPAKLKVAGGSFPMFATRGLRALVQVRHKPAPGSSLAAW
eukprot:963873-Amphidinium_carterae.1